MLNKFFDYKVNFETATDDGGGGGGDTVPEWVGTIEDDELKSSLSKFDSQDALLEAIGYEAPPEKEYDFRDGLDDDLKKTAERYNSVEDMLRSIQDFRKRDSQVRIPGKDASDEEVAKYRKAIGVPDKAEEYEFPEIENLTDDIKESRKQWSERFYDMNIPRDQAKLMAQMVHEDGLKLQEEILKADKAFAEQQENLLRDEWKGEFDKNKELANRAFSEMAARTGIDVEELRKIETKDGRFLFDRPEMVKIFASIAREMDEGTLGVTEGDKETIQEQIDDLRSKVAEAQAKGDSKKANKLYQQEQALIAKMNGDRTIVGSQGRVA